jgi:hypothetical protein
LHGDLQEEIYMEKPLVYVQNDSNLVFILEKSLYGIKKSPQAWYAKMYNFLLGIDFSRFHSNPNVYTNKVGMHIIILVIYVDDLILTSSDPKPLTHVKSSLKKKFEMTNLGYLNYFLGLQVLQTKEGIVLSYSKYARELHLIQVDIGGHPPIPLGPPPLLLSIFQFSHNLLILAVFFES